ncbi:MAG: hypothetical protein NTY19_04930 [Planctomycetota bacterium]|nr:hypothetical protein [Planctomycetota bacterium]
MMVFIREALDEYKFDLARVSEGPVWVRRDLGGCYPDCHTAAILGYKNLSDDLARFFDLESGSQCGLSVEEFTKRWSNACRYIPKKYISGIEADELLANLTREIGRLRQRCESPQAPTRNDGQADAAADGGATAQDLPTADGTARGRTGAELAGASLTPAPAVDARPAPVAAKHAQASGGAACEPQPADEAPRNAGNQWRDALSCYLSQMTYACESLTHIDGDVRRGNLASLVGFQAPYSLNYFWRQWSEGQRLLDTIPADALQDLTALAGKPWDLAARRTLDAIAKPLDGTRFYYLPGGKELDTDEAIKRGLDIDDTFERIQVDLDAAIPFRMAPPAMANENRAMMTAFETADFSTWPALLEDLERLTLDLQAIRGRRYRAGSGEKQTEAPAVDAESAPAAVDHGQGRGVVGALLEAGDILIRGGDGGPTIKMQDSMGIDVCGEFRRLEDLFRGGSATWPNLQSLLRTWPEGGTCPEFPDEFSPQDFGLSRQEHIDGVFCVRTLWIGAGVRDDFPDWRFRDGRAGEMFLRYDDSGPWENCREVRDTNAAYACLKRHVFLTSHAGKLLTPLRGLGILSEDTLGWSGPVMPRGETPTIRWMLAVHEIVSRDDMRRVGSAECQRFRDFFYASAQACSILAERLAQQAAGGKAAPQEPPTPPPLGAAHDGKPAEASVPGVETTVGKRKGVKPAVLQDEMGISRTTLTGYAKSLGICRERRKNFEYSIADVRRILRLAVESTQDAAVRSKCQKALAKYA